jgi:hypothetical protein
VYNARDGSLNAEGQFTFEGPAVLTVLDSYCASDRYRVFDNGVAIGRTGLEDPDHYSRGSFTLGPGPHSIRLENLAGEGNLLDNGGYIRADSLD